MKTRIDEYNGSYVAFVTDNDKELRKDFPTEEAAKAWLAEVAPAPKKVVKKVAKKKAVKE